MYPDVTTFSDLSVATILAILVKTIIVNRNQDPGSSMAFFFAGRKRSEARGSVRSKRFSHS
jgi:hypothetical protein